MSCSSLLALGGRRDADMLITFHAPEEHLPGPGSDAHVPMFGTYGHKGYRDPYAWG